jgi:T-complex protein 1 subunit eta
VVVIANEFMKEAKHFVEEGVHPQLIIKAYREAALLVKKIRAQHKLRRN